MVPVRSLQGVFRGGFGRRKHALGTSHSGSEVTRTRQVLRCFADSRSVRVTVTPRSSRPGSASSCRVRCRPDDAADARQ